MSMSLFQKKGLWDSGKIMQLPIDQIAPAPDQPRRTFPPDSLQSLSQSIQQLGVLQPLSVRRVDGQWYLVAGERRLRAAQMAGFTHVPCLSIATDSQTASLLTMMENLQRQDLNFLEEARGLLHIIDTFHLSQTQLAERLGRSQSAIANKLRLLKLPDHILTALCEGGCTERHARALLRLADPQQLQQATDAILRDELTVAESEVLVATLLCPTPPKANPHRRFIPKDIRIFMNTIHRSLNLMKTAGLDAHCVQEEQDGGYVVTIHIAKPSAVS